jgi:hypothetical protein
MRGLVRPDARGAGAKMTDIILWVLLAMLGLIFAAVLVRSL